ncbi:MAG: NfeD family protein [Cohaesibacter sp.]|jgi:membrane protein implicated in regulation of membrane protease activity|nr:NfeD family protein [Cohaesibacter sp.]
MIAALYEGLGGWFWVLIGLALLVLELVAPGTFFLWFGVSAILVGLLDFLFDLGWQSEFLLFGILSLALVFVGRFVLNRFQQVETDRPLLNERGLAFIGKEFVLAEPIENGFGRIKVNDTYWRISGADCAAGAKVKVSNVDGGLLLVEPTDQA